MIEEKSLDIFAAKLAQLRELFPEALTEGKIDFKRLQAVLGDAVSFNKEHYELSWAGKSEARAQIQKATRATLIPSESKLMSLDSPQSGNIFIEGENLDVLHVLQRAYFGKIKMIYIDPPYNTGNDSFVYPDDYSERQDEYKKRAGITDKDGFLNKQDLWKKNNKENGQFHSVWLSMMYPRLYLARNLLREDGVIFISIDDNEQANLKLLCDEIFGAENFVANIVWQKKYAATNDAKGFSAMHDHILVYQKSNCFERRLLPRTEEQDKPYKNDDGDGKGLWRSDNLLVKSFSQSGVYPIINPNTGIEYLPPEGSSWRASKETMQRWLEENRIYFGKEGTGAPQLKRYLNEVQDGRVPTTWWKFEDVGHNDAANKELASLFGAKAPFDTPKPSSLIRQMLNIATNKNDIILDFFAGSGTTAHAVLDLNEQDGGNRQFICVQLPEHLDENSEAYKAGYKTIADICKARISKVIAKIQADRDNKIQTDLIPETPKQVLGFNSFKLAPSNFKQWRGDIEEHAILEQLELFKASEQPHSENKAMLIELLLKAGFPLTENIEINTIADQEIYNVESGKLLFFFDDYNDTVKDFIFTLKPNSVVCLNRVFKNNDQALTNFQLSLKDAGIELQII
jgi:adenine-specific DNA-methyltransferase